MRSDTYKPQHALNKAFRKVKPSQGDFETFIEELDTLVKSASADESEEHNKRFIIDFLKNTQYDAYSVNTKGRLDLVIHEGKTSNTPVSVILETKRPSNKSEMLTRDDINRKALHELILYYLRERITNENFHIKHLIATNTYEWFIFDASDFEKTFANSKVIRKHYDGNVNKILVNNKTEFFYENVAKPFVKQLEKPLPYTHVDLRDYFDEEDEEKLEKKRITLYKLFSPEHLLKLPFANDSNTLDRRFYAELLHIIKTRKVKR